MTVIYEAADGEVWTPWGTDGRVPPGFRRRELRGAELKAFERDMNRKEQARYHEHHRRREEQIAERSAQDRSDLRQRARELGGVQGEAIMAYLDRHNTDSRVRMNYQPGFRRDG